MTSLRQKARQIANQIRKELTAEELLEKIPRDKFDPDTEKWNYIRKRLEPLFNHFFIPANDRDNLTDTVVYELEKLSNEKPRDPSEISETNKMEKQAEKKPALFKIKYPDAYNDDKPEVEKRKDAEGNIYYETKEPKNPEISKSETSEKKKIIPENAENAELFPELFNKPR